MPAQGTQTGHSAEADKKIKQAKRRRIKAQTTRPAPVSQPGPFTDAERKKVARNEQTPAYQKARQKARVHGPATGRGKRLGEDKSVTPSQQRAIDRGVKAARIRYVHRTRPTGKKLITRELEGKGVLAKLLNKTAEKAGPTGGKILSRSVRPIQSQSAAQVNEKLATNLAKDVITFPSQAITSTYVPVAGAYEAAKGHPERLKKLGKDIKEGDPVYNTVAAGVEAVKGNSAKAKAHLKVARDAATEHPGLTALEVAGVKGGVGRATSRALRGGGRAVRKAGKVTGSKTVERAGGKVRRAGSTERPSRRVPGTNVVETRAYSRDTFTKVRQINRDRAARAKSKRLHREADQAQAKGREDRATDLRRQAHEADPTRVPAREIRRQVDEDLQLHEDIRRRHRAETAKTTTKIVKSAGRGKRALNPVAQRIVRADKTDIQRYIDELKTEAKSLSRSKLRANRTLRKQLQKVVDDPKADMVKLEAAAKAFHEHTAPAQRKLAKLNVFDSEQQQRRAVIPYAVRRMGAKYDPVTERIVDAQGHELSTGRIVTHMEANGESPAAFLTQAPNRRGALNFNIRGERAPSTGPKGTTGAATRQGTFDIHPDTLVEGAAQAQGLVDATKHFRSLVKRYGKRGENGKIQRFASKRKAEQAAADYLHHDNGDPNPGAVPMRAIRLNAIGNTKAPLEGLLDDVNKLTDEQQNSIVESMKDALMGKEGKGQWALIPEAAAQRIVEHLNAQGGGGGLKTVQLVNQVFRKTVLSTSPSWLAGNVVEASGRAALAHAGPRSWWTSRQVLKRLETLDPKMAEELLSRALGGGHFTSVDRAGVRRGAEQFAGTDLAGIATALGKFWRSPGPKQAAHAWNVYTDVVMRQVNGRFEKNVQHAMLGAALRKSPLMNQRILKLSKTAHDEAARGLMNTDAQRAFGRQVDIMYGKYGKLSPSMKKAVSTYTPFISWWVNSVYFVYRTLPRDHPVVTGLIAAAEQATEEWRIQHGLDQFVSGAVPAFLQGSLPLKGGRRQRAPFRYTPFGAFGDPGGTIAGQLTPAASGVVSALEGRDWTGRELRVKDANGKSRAANPLELAVFAGHSFLSSTVPFLNQAERIKAQGVQALNPIKPTNPPKKKSSGRRIRRSSGGSSGSFFGGSSGSSSSGGGGSFFGP